MAVAWQVPRLAMVVGGVVQAVQAQETRAERLTPTLVQVVLVGVVVMAMSVVKVVLVEVGNMEVGVGVVPIPGGRVPVQVALYSAEQAEEVEVV